MISWVSPPLASIILKSLEDFLPNEKNKCYNSSGTKFKKSFDWRIKESKSELHDLPPTGVQFHGNMRLPNDYSALDYSMHNISMQSSCRKLCYEKSLFEGDCSLK